MDLSAKKLELNKIEIDLKKLKQALNVDSQREELARLEKLTEVDGFYQDKRKSQKVFSKINGVKKIIEKYENVYSIYEDSMIMLEMLEQELDLEMYKDLEKNIENLTNKISRLEIDALLDGEYDSENAIVTIHPGAGGTESQDWASMLYRMYLKWANNNEYTTEVLDYLDGEEAGLKSVTFLVKGINAYGYLKAEKGVHRLVRISPFDSNSRRHTSFASVEVMPELPDNIEINIVPEDLEVDTFRASGAGGQHVNKTSSAIRIKHIPTGIVVSCQTERSQLQNRENAMKMLRAKIYQLEIQKQKEKEQNIKGEVLDNSWGNQIRSYVFCPYTLVKDHRTNYEIGNVAAVMDGKIDDFIFEYLKMLKTLK